MTTRHELYDLRSTIFLIVNMVINVTVTILDISRSRPLFKTQLNYVYSNPFSRRLGRTMVCAEYGNTEGSPNPNG
jgi:hypothetical protein